MSSDRNSSDENIPDPSLSLTGNTNTFKDYLDWLENYLKTLKLIFTCLDKIFCIQCLSALQFTPINGVHCSLLQSMEGTAVNFNKWSALQFTSVNGGHCSLPQSIEVTADDVDCNKCE